MAIPIIGGQKKEKKPNTKEILEMLGGLAQQVHALHLSVQNSDKALNEYIGFKKDGDAFLDHLKEKYEPKNENDNVDKKTKDK